MPTMVPLSFAMSFWLALVLHFAAAAATKKPTVRRFSLTVSQKNLTYAGQTVLATLFNGSYPGPTIRARVGDVVLVNVTNAMEDSNTTVHWHGLSQRMSPAADGTVASQWPMAPSTSFEYAFIPQEEDAGLRFYHSHVGLQAMTAFGPLIIEHDNPPFHYDGEHILTLSDWYNKTTEVMEAGLWADPFVWLGSANYVAVNGRPFTGELDAKSDEPPYVIDVDYDKTYFLRWIGAQGTMYYAVSILNHTMTLVEADGTYTRPHTLDTIELGAGQRYGTLLKTKSAQQVADDTQGGCYWVRLESQWRKPATNGWALLRYPTCRQVELARPPTANNSECLLPTARFGWIASELAPLPLPNARKMPRDEEVTRRQVIRVKQDAAFKGSKADVWRQNSYVYNESTTTDVPYLLQLYLNMTGAPSYERAMDNRTEIGWDEESKTYVAKKGEVLDIVLINRPSALSGHTEIHPFHFHSSKAWHLASGPGTFSDEALAAARAKGYKDPVPRDTFNLWPEPGSSLNATDLLPIDGDQDGGWTVLRYSVTAGSAGSWPLHCHLLAHLIMGMSSTFSFFDDASDLTKRIDSCDPNYFLYGKSVVSPYTLAERRGGATARARV